MEKFNLMSHLALHSPSCKSHLQTSHFKLLPTVENCVLLLVRCPRNCHLIIACPFTCQPHVPNTSACKNPMISCPLCTSSPSWDIYRQNTIFLLQNLVQGSFSGHSPSHLSNCQFVYHLPHLFHICQFICCFQLRVFIVEISKCRS